MLKTLRWGSVLLLTGLLCACGQTGSLYMPHAKMVKKAHADVAPTS